MTTTPNRDETRAFVEARVGRVLTDAEVDRAVHYASVASLFDLSPAEVAEARAFGILA